MIKLIEARSQVAEFDHPIFRLSMYRKAPTLGWEADLFVHASPKEVQQLRLDLAEKLKKWQTFSVLKKQQSSRQ